MTTKPRNNRPDRTAIEISRGTSEPFGKWITVESRRYRVPDQDEVEVHYVNFPDIAVIVGEINQNVVLIRQFRYALDSWIIEAPAGRVEPTEDPYATARRELKEETGFTCESLVKLGELRVSPHLSSETTHVFLAKGLQRGKPYTMAGEFIEVMEVPADEVRGMVHNHVIVDSKTIAALTLANLV